MFLPFASCLELRSLGYWEVLPAFHADPASALSSPFPLHEKSRNKMTFFFFGLCCVELKRVRCLH